MKKGFTLVELLAVLVVLAIIATIAYPVVTSSIESSKEQAYETQIAEIEREARRWALDHSEELPEMDGSNQIGVNVDTLIQGGYITKTKDGKLYNPKDTSKTMDGCVIIEYSKEYNQYLYNYSEECKLKSNKIADILKEQYKEDNTVGLLKEENSYYYKGTNEEVANNFVWFGGHLWRVLTINEDNSLTMITQQPVTAIHPAGSVWATEQQYKDSYINTWLNEVFLGSMNDIDKEKLQDNTFNIGIYNNVSEITTTQKVGLLDETQYTKTGGANSFLDIKDNWWLGNRYSTSYVRDVGSSGNLGSYGVALAVGVRPVIKISNLTFSEGEGTLENPYREKREAKDITQIKVGEYISVPTSGADCGSDNRCLFRVVSKESNAVKVTLNGLLSSTSVFGDTSTYVSTRSSIASVVTTFANTIDNKYRYQGNDTTFGIGEYGRGVNYTAAQTPTYIGTVGLPVVGEMFTANDIDISTSNVKTFVNVNTIENPIASNWYWTMNAYSASSVRGVNNGGDLNDFGVARAYGVRPVLYLNASSSLTFANGEGTAESPFTLE